MESNSKQISVANPCPFLIRRMQKDGDNFFCPGCSKQIIDFRNKTYEEIKCVSTKDTCGIFYPEQLTGQRKMRFDRQSLFHLLTFLSFLGFYVKPLNAQTSDTLSTKALTIFGIKKMDTRKINSESTEKLPNPIDKEKKRKKKSRKNPYRGITGCPAF